MKKLIVIFLALLLCGCGAKSSPDGAGSPTENNNEAEQAPLISLYDADNAVEQATSGAVRAYPLGDGVYAGLVPFGEKLLVVSGDGVLTLLQGDNGEIAATEATDLSDSWGQMDLRTGKQGVAYYAEDYRELVVLDGNLQQTKRVPLPEDILGKPVIQLDRGEVFYCTGGDIRAINIQSGVSRLVRTHGCMSQELLGSFFDDSLLSCFVVDEQGAESIIYVESETGRELGEDTLLGKFYTYGQNYYALRNEDGVQQKLFGSRDGEVMSLDVQGDNLVPVLAMNGAVRYEQTQDGLFLEYYDLAEGRITAQTTLSGVEGVTTIVSGETYVWILSGQTLYRWDTAMHPVEGSPVCTSHRYTADAPDTDGLAQCQSRADKLAQDYGFTLQIWEEAAAGGKNYGAVAEYQVSTIQAMLDEVEAVLEKLPKDFLSITGSVRVCLVRSLENGEDCALYWAGGTCHVILTCNNVTDSLLWGLGNAVDSHVLGNSFDYDTWEELNPWWFDYTYDHEENLQRSDPEQFLEGDSRAYTEITAMSFPTEDRSRLFANALMEDNAEMFASDTMQKKLRAICIAIREAYGWEDSTEVFTWEQYLKKPIAASK